MTRDTAPQYWRTSPGAGLSLARTEAARMHRHRLVRNRERKRQKQAMATQGIRSGSVHSFIPKPRNELSFAECECWIGATANGSFRSRAKRATGCPAGSGIGVSVVMKSRLWSWANRFSLESTCAANPASVAASSEMVVVFIVEVHSLRCVTGEDIVARFDGVVAGKAALHERRVGRFAVVEVGVPPAAGLGVVS